jgi:hypothetical protein
MLSQKQKKALIAEFNPFSPQYGCPQPKRKNAKKRAQRQPQSMQRQPRRGGVNLGTRGRMVNPGTGAHYVQDSSVPLSASFSGSESLGSINGSVGFVETQYPINPGQAVMFPRESQEAKLWEMYEFDELAFEFRTTINQFASNAYGRVTVGVDYDGSDPPPATLSQAEISRPVAAGLPYDSIFLKLRKSDMNGWMKRHFVRPGNLPGAADIKMYDIGVLNVGTSGNANVNAIGELWVHFKGKYFNQILESVTTPPTNYSASQFQSNGVEALVSGTPKNLALATPASNGLSLVNTAGSIALPAGNYLVDFDTDTSAATSLTSSTASLQVNGTGVVSAVTNIGAVALMTTCSGAGSWFVSATGASTVLTLAVTVVGTGACTATGALRIVAI